MLVNAHFLFLCSLELGSAPSASGQRMLGLRGNTLSPPSSWDTFRFRERFSASSSDFVAPFEETRERRMFIARVS